MDTINNSMTLMEFLVRKYPDSPRTRIKKLLQSGKILVNNKPVTLNSHPLQKGDTVDISKHVGSITKSSFPFKILHEDQQVIVIEKPAGIATSSIDGSKNVVSLLTTYLRDASKGIEKAHVVHRLDKEVSGILLFAKSEPVMEKIKERWKETEKRYYALVEGKPVKSEDTIKSWLIGTEAMKMKSIQREAPGAKFAITTYTLIKMVGGNALLDVQIETGRKNQIRVHLADIGCPIVGDRKYGASDLFTRRVRLHAYYLSFPHPVTARKVIVESAMPKGFLQVKEADEKYK